MKLSRFCSQAFKNEQKAACELLIFQNLGRVKLYDKGFPSAMPTSPAWHLHSVPLKDRAGPYSSLKAQLGLAQSLAQSK